VTVKSVKSHMVEERPDRDADLEARYRQAYAARSEPDDWGDIDAWHSAARIDRFEEGENGGE